MHVTHSVFLDRPNMEWAPRKEKLSRTLPLFGVCPFFCVFLRMYELWESK